MGGPGGGNNPMAFGRSKARFQMEPNTGVTFEDVAGVDEAKQDFMEVSQHCCAACSCLSCSLGRICFVVAVCMQQLGLLVSHKQPLFAIVNCVDNFIPGSDCRA